MRGKLQRETALTGCVRVHRYRQSWLGWEFKPYVEITGQDCVACMHGPRWLARDLWHVLLHRLGCQCVQPQLRSCE